jgi:hypothetical protein
VPDDAIKTEQNGYVPRSSCLHRYALTFDEFTAANVSVSGYCSAFGEISVDNSQIQNWKIELRFVVHTIASSHCTVYQMLLRSLKIWLLLFSIELLTELRELGRKTKDV